MCQIHPLAVYWLPHASCPRWPLVHRAHPTEADAPESPSGLMRLLCFSFPYFWHFSGFADASSQCVLQNGSEIHDSVLFYLVLLCLTSVYLLMNHRPTVFCKCPCECKRVVTVESVWLFGVPPVLVFKSSSPSGRSATQSTKLLTRCANCLHIYSKAMQWRTSVTPSSQCHFAQPEMLPCHLLSRPSETSIRTTPLGSNSVTLHRCGCAWPQPRVY